MGNVFRILPHVLQAIAAVELFVTDVKGPDKKAAAMKFLAVFLPSVEGASGGRLDVDDEKVKAAVGAVIDAVIALANLVKKSA